MENKEVKVEEFLWSKSDRLQTEVETPSTAKSVVVKYGDKYGKYEISGTVYYSTDGNQWYKLKAYESLRREAPFICLTLDPSIHRKLRFELTLKGGKFQNVGFSEENCQKVSEDQNKRIEEAEKKKSKGFLEQLNDLMRSVALVWFLILLVLIVVAIIIFKWLKSL